MDPIRVAAIPSVAVLAAVLGGCGGSSEPPPCKSGVTTLATSSQEWSNFVVDDRFAYYVVTDIAAGFVQGGSLLKVPLGGGSPVTVATVPTQVSLLAMNQTTFYLNDADTIQSLPLAGGARTTLRSHVTYLQEMLASDTELFWAISASSSCGGPMGCTDANGSFWKMDLAGGAAPERLLSAAPEGFTLDGSNVYVLANDGVLSQPLGGGQNTYLYKAMLYGGSAGPTVTSTYLYYSVLGSGNDTDLLQLPLGGGTPKRIYTGQSISAIATGGGNVYVSDYKAGTVVKIPEAGGAPVTIASGQGQPIDLVSSNGCLYWLDVPNQAPVSLMSARM